MHPQSVAQLVLPFFYKFKNYFKIAQIIKINHFLFTIIFFIKIVGLC